MVLKFRENPPNHDELLEYFKSWTDDVEQNVDWRKYRAAHREWLPDLQGAGLGEAFLKNAHLKGANLENADLRGTNLYGANLSDANLKGANIENADLRSANLQRADFTGAYLKGSTLEDADCRDTSFRGANLADANLRDTNQRYAVFRDTDLSDANLGGSNLTGASFRNANLRNAFLHETHSIGADFRGANLEEANLQGAYLKLARLNEGNLGSVALQRACLDGADLSYSSLNRSLLFGTSLVGVNLNRADFGEAKMAGTILDSDLSGAVGLESITHKGPSVLSLNSILSFEGAIPERFLKGCGVRDDEVDYFRSSAGMPIPVRATYISYGPEDEDFAKRLHDLLQNRGIRCWLDEIEEFIHEDKSVPLRVDDRVILCASRDSLESIPIDDIVSMAIQVERKGGEIHTREFSVLTVLDLDGYMHTNRWKNEWKNLVVSRSVASFVEWRTSPEILERDIHKVIQGL